MLWIRTWYGDETVNRAAADAACYRLCRKAFQQNDPDKDYDSSSVVNPLFVFDDNAADFGRNQSVLVGTTPNFILKALIRYPDQLDASSDGTELENIFNTVQAEQDLLVVVADREACEKGFILQLALDHRAKVLPGFVRSKASNSETYAVS